MQRPSELIMHQRSQVEDGEAGEEGGGSVEAALISLDLLLLFVWTQRGKSVFNINL